MRFGPDVIAEAIPRRLRTELNIASAGAYALAASIDISAISPHYAEYTAVPGGGIFIAGAIAAALDIYRLRRSSYFSPDDDPEREDLEPVAEVVELSAYRKLLIPEDLAA